MVLVLPAGSAGSVAHRYGAPRGIGNWRGPLIRTRVNTIGRVRISRGRGDVSCLGGGSVDAQRLLYFLLKQAAGSY